MGQRLCIQYSMDSTTYQNKNLPHIVTIYQHWSGYGEAAREAFDAVSQWITEFQERPTYDFLLPEERFFKFVTALGSGEIISDAYFTKESSEALFKEVDPNLNRNEGLVGIDDDALNLMSWADFPVYQDLDDSFADTDDDLGLPVSDLQISEDYLWETVCSDTFNLTKFEQLGDVIEDPEAILETPMIVLKQKAPAFTQALLSGNITTGCTAFLLERGDFDKLTDTMTYHDLLKAYMPDPDEPYKLDSMFVSTPVNIPLDDNPILFTSSTDNFLTIDYMVQS